MNKIIGVGIVLMLVIIGILSGCVSKQQYNSVNGVVKDVAYVGRVAKVMYSTDVILTFDDGEKSAYDLSMFCRNHINESITVKYYWYDDINVNLAGKYFIIDYFVEIP